MYLNAGDLDRRITLQALTKTIDARTNARVETWTDGATVWAKVKESATANRARGDAGEAVAAYARPMEVDIRWRDLDKANTRLKYGTRILRITGTAELGRRVGLRMTVEEWGHE